MEHLLSHHGIMILMILGGIVGALFTIYFWSLEQGDGSLRSMLEMHL